MVRFFYFALFVAVSLWAAADAVGASSADVEPAPVSADVDTVESVVDSCLREAQAALSGEELTTYRAFVEIDDPAVTILPKATRQAMAYDAASGGAVLTTPSSVGQSTVMEPHSRSYLRVGISAVSEATYKVLRRGGKDIVGVVYTVGDSATVRDSELRFYDSRFRPIALKKVLTPLGVEDFFDFTGVDKETRSSLLGILPFMAVEYVFAPGSDEMTVRLTAVGALSWEDQRCLAPYLRSPLRLVWDGGKYRRMD
ncbi:MAG: DUF3256 family protein [Lepagella sp.]